MEACAVNSSGPPTPQQLALRYALTRWERETGGVPPMELSRAIVATVVQVGYTKKLVDEMIDSYKKNSTT
jgi:hypothetical protein